MKSSNSKQQTANSKQQTVNSRQQTADSKQQARNENADPSRVGEFCFLGAWFPGPSGLSAAQIEDLRSKKNQRSNRMNSKIGDHKL